MTFSEHRNGLASTTTCNNGSKKQGKCYSNHQFPLHILQQSKHHTREFRYEVSKCYSLNFQWVFGMQLIDGVGREPTKLLGMLNLPWQGFEKKAFTSTEAHPGTEERLLRDLAIEEAIQIEIKDTPSHKNKSYVKWCDISDEERNKKSQNSPLHMIWAGRRYHLERYMTPLVGTTSSPVVYLRELLLLSSIQRTSGSVMLRIRGEKNQITMSAQITLREYLKVLRLVKLWRW